MYKKQHANILCSDLQHEAAALCWNDRCCSHQSNSTAGIHQGCLCSEQSSPVCSDRISHLPRSSYMCKLFHTRPSNQFLEHHTDMVHSWGNLENLEHTYHIVGPQTPHDIRKFLLPIIYKLTKLIEILQDIYFGYTFVVGLF